MVAAGSLGSDNHGVDGSVKAGDGTESMSNYAPMLVALLWAVVLLTASGLLGCDEEPVVLVDYFPRCVGFVFEHFEVSRNGPGWVLTAPVQPYELPEHLDVEITGCDSGWFSPVRVYSAELRSVPSPDASAAEPAALGFLLEPDVDLPVLLQEPDEHAPKDSVPRLTIRIPTEALMGIASHRAVLEVTTNAAEADAISYSDLRVCNEDPETGRNNYWCSVSEAPTPDDGRFLTRIELQITP